MAKQNPDQILASKRSLSDAGIDGTFNPETNSEQKKKSKKENNSNKGEKILTIIHTKIDSEDLIDPHDVIEDVSIPSSAKARLLFQWMIAPISLENFYENYWEKKPLVIKRKNPEYYDGWFSTDEIQRILSEHSLSYGEDIDITSYINNTRSTLNSSIPVSLKDVTKYFEQGCSVRFLCPQKFSDPLWHLLSYLEEEWGCMSGANTYWTPKGCQGFAPHYDDIEAFLLQVEGSKHWKVYGPLDEENTLPRHSSENFSQDQIGKPILETMVEQGDLIYFPRGFIHQATSPPEIDSLHVTVSAGQQNSWADFMELVLPQAMAAAIKENINMRKLLPRNFFNYLGAVHSDQDDDTRRKEFALTMKKNLRLIMNEAMEMLDAAADQMARNFLVDRLPPPLLDEEEDCTVAGSPLPKINVDTNIRLVRANIARLAIEDGKAIVYHAMDNSRRRNEIPISPLEFELDDAESIECILLSYPEYIRVGDLPIEDPKEKIELTRALYNEGFIMFERDN